MINNRCVNRCVFHINNRVNVVVLRNNLKVKLEQFNRPLVRVLRVYNQEQSV